MSLLRLVKICFILSCCIMITGSLGEYMLYIALVSCDLFVEYV